MNVMMKVVLFGKKMNKAHKERCWKCSKWVWVDDNDLFMPCCNFRRSDNEHKQEENKEDNKVSL